MTGGRNALSVEFLMLGTTCCRLTLPSPPNCRSCPNRLPVAPKSYLSLRLASVRMNTVPCPHEEAVECHMALRPTTSR